MRIILLISIIMLMTACAVSRTVNTNPGGSNTSLSRWQGQNISAIVNRLGTPNETFQARNGIAYYVYTTQNYQSYPASGLAPGYATLTRGYVQVPTQESFYANYSILKCALVFETDSNKVITATQTKGYNCDSTIAYLNK